MLVYCVWFIFAATNAPLGNAGRMNYSLDVKNCSRFVLSVDETEIVSFCLDSFFSVLCYRNLSAVSFLFV